MMTAQDILRIAGISLLGTGALLIGMALYLFFSRNIRDLIADLNGTKRTEALAAMAKETSRSRRRSKTGDTTGSLSSGPLLNGEPQVQTPIPSQASQQPEVIGPEAVASDQVANDSADTTVMQDDNAETTVMEPGAADATTLLVEESDSDDITTVLENVESESNAETQLDEEPTDWVVVTEDTSEKPVPESFHIVRKIVLAQSIEFVKPE